jgi:hypothetical protein
MLTQVEGICYTTVAEGRIYLMREVQKQMNTTRNMCNDGTGI